MAFAFEAWHMPDAENVPAEVVGLAMTCMFHGLTPEALATEPAVRRAAIAAEAGLNSDSYEAALDWIARHP